MTCRLCHGIGTWSEDHRRNPGRGPAVTGGLCACGAVPATYAPQTITAAQVVAREAEFDAIRAAYAA